MKNILAAFSLTVLAAAAGQAQASLLTISPGELLGDAAATDFSACATGALTAGCTGLPLSSVSLVGGTANMGDVLNTGANGNAVGARAGQAVIVPVGGAIDDQQNNGGFRFEFSTSFTQFGFRNVDQGSMQLRVTAGDGSFLDIYGGDTLPFPMRYFSSSVAVNAFEVVCIANCAGYAIDDLTVAGLSAEVPEPGSMALAGLGLLAWAGAARRRARSK